MACEHHDISGPPDITLFHRMLGWHAPRLRRVLLAAAVGLVVAVVAWPFTGWELALLAGWDVAAALFLGAAWYVIVHADAPSTALLANREDETRRTATALVLTASVASLLAVGITLGSASGEHGGGRTALVTGAVVTVVLSWSAVNTMFTLRYADLYYRGSSAVDFGYRDSDERPDYRDFAYLAFTIGMCYQVSDTTLRDRGIRRTVLVHALVSYVFGVVIIAAGINLVAGLLG